ncbi:hypothetical protein [Catenulispora pinistramenti]|uniref:hypothetical protein n=1 Tax=Catenulispora pinistramenti TaxID=2705254 RepID=UPI001BAD0E77|nr:hypothetical protein [Catenulispora pinistramenti]
MTEVIVLDVGGWISGPAADVIAPQMARDIRDGREGVLMADPSDHHSCGMFWLRPVGGGREWDVPKRYLQMIDNSDESAA